MTFSPEAKKRWNFNELTRSDIDFKEGSYAVVAEVVQSLHRRGMLERFHGECLACADIVQQTLAQKGIISRIVETQLSIISADPRHKMMWRFVGFNNPNYGAQGIDTHVVVITESTPRPILLDLSISGYLHGDRPWVIEPIDQGEPEPLVIGRYQIDDLTLTYHPKQDPRLMGLHQQTLLDRMRASNQLSERVKNLRWLMVVAAGLGIVNFLFNSVIIVANSLTHWFQ